jgi:hypothetical protein
MPKRYKKKKHALNRVLPEDRHAVAAIDPGGTSGVFAAIVTPRGSMKETCQEVFRPEWETRNEIFLGQLSGDFRTQAAAIANTLRDWFASWTLDYVAPVNHHVVIEDWDTHRQQPGREIISAWIAAGVDCLLTEGINPILKPEQITYFYATQAKHYATNERLKLWNLYSLTTGKPHARDASRHWATRVNQIIK